MSFSNFSPKINRVFCGYLFCLLFAILALVHDHGRFFWATEVSVWMRHDCIREPSRPCCICLSYLFSSFKTSLPWLYWQLQTYHFKITRFNAKVFEKYSLRTCFELQNPFSHIPTPTQRYRKAGSTGAGRTCRIRRHDYSSVQKAQSGHATWNAAIQSILKLRLAVVSSVSHASNAFIFRYF